MDLLAETGVDPAGLTKPELIRRIQDLEVKPQVEPDEVQPDEVKPDEVEPEVSQREVAEIAMDDWQNASTIGFDCKSGRRVDDGADFYIVGPNGEVQNTVSFRRSWPPTCTCTEGQRWGSRMRCKHACMILVKCGVPYAAVADSDWNPDELEVRSIVDHLLGRWSPIPLSEAEAKM